MTQPPSDSAGSAEGALNSLTPGSAALVVGGASGLGAATARRLANRGLAVTVADRDTQAGSQVTSELTGGSFVEADVTDRADIEAAAATAAESGPLRFVVSCAGIAPTPLRLVSRRGVAMASDQWQSLIDVHLTGTFNTIVAAGPHMAGNVPDGAGERGVIVVTSSVVRVGMEGGAGYAAAKAGIVALARTAALDLAPLGIRCVAIAPGTFDTPMLGVVNERSTALHGEVNAFPSRMGQPDEFASLVEHVGDNRYLNGTCLDIDGAFHR